VLGGIVFFRRSFTVATPIVDLRAFANRNFALGTGIAAAISASLYTLVYLTPLFLGQVRGYNSFQIGQVMMVQGAAMFCTAPIVGRALRRTDPRLVLALGLVLVSAGTWINARLTADWGQAEFFVPQLVRGSGLLLCFFPLISIAMGTLPADEVKNASGLYNVTRNIGGAIGLALVNTLINARTWLHWQMLDENLRAGRPVVREALAGMRSVAGGALGGDGAQAGLAMLARQMRQQVAAMTYGDLYAMLATMITASALLLPLIQKPRVAVSPADAH
jgi:DHA2 family multidrug resistance protein